MWINRLKKAFLLLPFFLFNSSCEESEVYFVDCDACNTAFPSYVIVPIEFTINTENPYVNFTLYEGSIEDGEIIAEDVSYDTKINWSLAINRTYSILAEYKDGGRCINVVDGTNLRTKMDKSTCDSECYIILGDKLDARLKF